MFGILNVYKPKGMTSHDVVSVLRRTLHMKRIGHTGTLDPDAEGVLPILLGKATRLSDLLMAEEKRYFAGVKLGIVTDTDDTSGTVIKTCEPQVSEEEIMAAAARFLGKTQQIPPMYSAIKVDGQKLYQLARKGITTERKPREIEIYSLEVSDVEKDFFHLHIHCSKGTYIRALCRDIGEALGTGAAMASLVREQSGCFTLNQCYTLEQIAEAAEKGSVSSLLISVDEVLATIPSVCVNDETAAKIKNGIRLRPNQLGVDKIKENSLLRVYHEGALLCVLKSVLDNGQILMAMDKSFY